MIMLKPMHIYVEYKVIVRKKVIIDDNEIGSLKLQCDAFKEDVRSVMDKIWFKDKFDYDKSWDLCTVFVDEV